MNCRGNVDHVSTKMWNQIGNLFRRKITQSGFFFQLVRTITNNGYENHTYLLIIFSCTAPHFWLFSFYYCNLYSPEHSHLQFSINFLMNSYFLCWLQSYQIYNAFYSLNDVDFNIYLGTVWFTKVKKHLPNGIFISKVGM